jgi:hypothetical protein
MASLPKAVGSGARVGWHKSGRWRSRDDWRRGGAKFMAALYARVVAMKCDHALCAKASVGLAFLLGVGLSVKYCDMIVGALLMVLRWFDGGVV